jgi:hypothetical protein
MQGRYSSFRARYPSRLAPDTAIRVAMMRALERAWLDPNHKIHKRFNTGTPPAAGPRVSSIRPNEKE